MESFWNTLPKPFFALAPMADVTDAAFRQIITECSKPDVLWTEQVSADGLAHPKARETLLKDFLFTSGEHPIVAQIFGSNPQNIESAARLAAELGFDGIDINMGCPDRSIEKQGAGACMIKTPDVARAVIQAAKKGVASAGRQIPVSVKTRVGYNAVEINEWIPALLSEKIAALTVHARTRKEMSKVPANWDHIKRVVELRNKIAPHTIIIGNGDVVDITDGMEKAKQTGCDGIMIGRAVFGNPWIFDRSRTITQKGNWYPPAGGPWYARLLPAVFAKKFRKDEARYTVSAVPLNDRLQILVKHAQLFEKLLGDVKSFAVMKKHFKAYVNGFDGAKELRVHLMENGNSAAEVKNIIKDFLNTL